METNKPQQETKEIDFYQCLKRIRSEQSPFSIKHVKLSLNKNEGGEANWLEQVKTGPNRNNINSDIMIGFENTAGEIRQIYIHSILEVQFPSTGEHFKLRLNF